MRTIEIFKVAIIINAISFVNVAAQGPGDLDGLTRIRTDVLTKRVSSTDITGGNWDFKPIKAGETREIFNVKGAGKITHIWITFKHGVPVECFRRKTVLRMYWDGEKNPSVESPIGDFFGQGWGEQYNYVSLPLAASPKDARSFVCYFPMPFSDGARIAIENQAEADIPYFFFYIDYEEHKSMPTDIGRFHAWWNTEFTVPSPTDSVNGKNTTGDRNYLVMDAEGAGHYVGINYFVSNPTPVWYGEGDDLFVIDGAPWEKAIKGTGTEDYFNTSWCPQQRVEHPYYGLVRINEDTYEQFMGRTHFYRFHIQDPIRFNKSLRFSIEHGKNNEQALELATVAYWYQTEPHKPFPPMKPVEERMPRSLIGSYGWDIYEWYKAWREKKGNRLDLWGNER